MSSTIRVAARKLIAESYFNVGDLVVHGRYKNKKAIIRAIRIDERGVPMVALEPFPKGRKKDREMSLFNIWHADPERRKKFNVPG